MNNKQEVIKNLIIFIIENINYPLDKINKKTLKNLLSNLYSYIALNYYEEINNKNFKDFFQTVNLTIEELNKKDYKNLINLKEKCLIKIILFKIIKKLNKQINNDLFYSILKNYEINKLYFP